MSIGKRIAFGAAAGWFGRGVAILLGLVLLPVLFRHLPKEELGVWLLLGQSWAAMGILDFGFGITLSRRIAMAKGKSGAAPDAPLTPESLSEIADLVASGTRIYRLMAGGVFVVSWLAGLYYLSHLELRGLNQQTVWMAWTVLCISQSINVWATVWNCLLQGVGYVGWDAIISSLVNALTLMTQIVAVLCGGGLVALASAAAVGAVAQRTIIRWFARRTRPDLFALSGRWNPAVLRGMPELAFRAWLTAVGVALVQNTDQFIITAQQGAENLPAFRSACVLVHNFTIIGVSLGLASSVFISHLWNAGNIPEVHRIVKRNCRLGLLVMLCTTAVMVVSGRELFDLWLGQGNYVGLAIIAALLVYETLDTQSYIISTSSRSTEAEDFGISSVLAGVLKIILSLWFIQQWGLLGLAVASLVALLLTNHSYMVLKGLKRLKMPLSDYGRTVLVPVLLWFAAAWVAASLTHAGVAHTSPWVRLLSVTAAVGLIFSWALWSSVLQPSERLRLLAKLSSLKPRAQAN